MCAADPPASPLPRAQVLERLAEVLLADVIAFRRVGWDFLSLRMSVNGSGGTVKGGRIALRSPVEGHLSNRELGRALDAFERLHMQHCRGEVSAELLQRIEKEHGVKEKVERLKSRL